MLPESSPSRRTSIRRLAASGIEGAAVSTRVAVFWTWGGKSIFTLTATAQSGTPSPPDEKGLPAALVSAVIPSGRSSNFSLESSYSKSLPSSSPTARHAGGSPSLCRRATNSACTASSLRAVRKIREKAGWARVSARLARLGSK